MIILYLLCAAAAVYALAFGLNAFRLALSALRREPIPAMTERIRAGETYTSLEDMSLPFMRVLITAEDPRFWKHRGFDKISIYRAFISNLRQHCGKASMRGGSTITQQLVKNVYLTHKKTFTRKLAELFISVYMEKKLSKWEILELYANVIYYGKGRYGVWEAASYFFGCDPSELTLNQSLSLACQLPNPNLFNPVDSPDLFRKRRNRTLRLLVRFDAVSPETAAALEKADWKDTAPDLRVTPLRRSSGRETGGKKKKVSCDSPLVHVKKLSPHHSGRRTRPIDRITPHCTAGRVSAGSLGKWFGRSSVKASSNYGIGWDGRIGLYVHEEDRSWCSSDEENDQRAVTVECASEVEAPYAMSEAVYRSLIRLCADICRRNGKKRLLWLDDREKALQYTPRDDEMLLTVHRWFADKECPGDWLYGRLPDLAFKVSMILELNG